jgi:hypothetical protein
MKNNQTQNSKAEINPWILAESDAKKKLIQNVTTLIHDAGFIPDKNEKNWITLLPYLSENFLEELKHTIIRESLRHLDKKNKW